MAKLETHFVQQTSAYTIRGGLGSQGEKENHTDFSFRLQHSWPERSPIANKG